MTNKARKENFNAYQTVIIKNIAIVQKQINKHKELKNKYFSESNLELAKYHTEMLLECKKDRAYYCNELLNSM